MTSPDTVIEDASRVEVFERRWSATIRITRTDGTTTEVFVCAEDEHSGLWIGDPAEHEEH